MPEPNDSAKTREVIRELSEQELQEKIAAAENGIEFCLSEEFLPEF
jgi:hypothetical protein